MNQQSKPDYLIPVNISNLVLNENAYFYKLKRNITSRDIQIYFNEALNDKNAAKRKFKSLIKEPLMDGGKEIAKYSLDIFEFKKKPSFFEKPEQNKWETKYGFFLLIEYKGYLAAIKKYVSGIQSLDNVAENIDYNILAHFLITNKSKFEKIVASNINTAENAIQRKISEAIDLKGILSRFGISKQIINSLRLDNEGEKHTVSLSTSRINSFKLKNKFEAVLFWMIRILQLIDSAFVHLPNSPFIDGFATPLKFEDIIDKLSPTYILLRFGSLKDEIDDNRIQKCYKKGKDDEEVDVNILEIINNNEKLFQLSKIDDRNYESGSLKIRINEHSISLSDKTFKEITLDYGDDNTLSLNQYLNWGNNFLINFDKIDHVYSHGKIFKDSKLLGDIENFFQTFITFDEIEKITSEKGNNYQKNSTHFDSNSLFGFIENTLASQSDCLICDDMGVEWGDFIAINKDEISFYHAKFHEDGLSASNLEEVFGQAQKNLGVLELTEEMIDYRKDRWLKNYKIDKIQTKISRIRKCPKSKDKIEKIKETVNSVSSNPNVRRKVYVVINFISKVGLQQSIKELKNDKIFEKKGVILQILWFVNSLLSSAHELNTELRIICKP